MRVLPWFGFLTTFLALGAGCAGDTPSDDSAPVTDDDDTTAASDDKAIPVGVESPGCLFRGLIIFR